MAGLMVKVGSILYGDIEPSKVGIGLRALDFARHYSRPDIFQLDVDYRPQSPVVFDDRKAAQDGA